MDLLFLYKQNSDFDFKEKLKLSLKSYIKGKPIRNEIPQGICESVSSLPSVIQLHIMLDPKNDRDIIDWSKSITRGRRNNMIKNVFRNTFPVIENPYHHNSEHNKF